MTKIFKEAKNETSFLKCGLMGFQGSGKTYTAADIAIGMHSYINSKKPVAFIDSEAGSDKVLPKMQAAKVKLIAVKTRSFQELCEAIREAEESSDILIIDSITHYWNELMESYMKQARVTRMTPVHWIPVKREWHKYADLYSFSKLHVIVCGRSGWRFGYVEEEDGAKQMTAVETRMKVEGEFGYEPELLLEMERIREEHGTIGAKVMRRCWVLKDKWDMIDGKYFDNPRFNDFMPHINCLHTGKKSKQHSIDLQKHSQELFKGSGESASIRMKKRDIALENIESELMLKFPGQSVENRTLRIKSLKKVFKTASWTEIKSRDYKLLEKGLVEIKKLKAKGGK